MIRVARAVVIFNLMESSICLYSTPFIQVGTKRYEPKVYESQFPSRVKTRDLEIPGLFLLVLFLNTYIATNKFVKWTISLSELCMGPENFCFVGVKWPSQSLTENILFFQSSRWQSKSGEEKKKNEKPKKKTTPRDASDNAKFLPISRRL